MSGWQFIATEFTGAGGEDGEHFIWEKVTNALKDEGEGVGILNYCIFDREQQIRYEPDILLVSRTFGLVVIEVKSCGINDIVDIRANRWKMQNFYASSIEPFKQAEKQLRAILKSCNREPALRDLVPGRVIVALPRISREEWRDRGFEEDHPACPPIIFGNELSKRTLLNTIETSATILQKGADPFKLNQKQWLLLQKRIVSPLPPTLHPELPPPTPTRRRSDVLEELNSWVSEVDMQQAEIALQIPPGPQRIRGIAGSGKTVLLCQKAARMHLQHPDWDIALVFFTRSLYQLIPDLLQQWLNYLSDENKSYDFQQGKLKVLHAWGTRERPGLYTVIRGTGSRCTTTRPPKGSPPERLAKLCKQLLEEQRVQPIFDAILIDEGQDLAVNDSLRYEDKQTIYWLAWEALRPISENTPNIRRLIWAYDEAQSLDSLKIPDYPEIFPPELSDSLSGRTTGPVYKGRIQRSIVMRRCYRTPAPILLAAHGIGMGLLRTAGMISGFTQAKDWKDIGYEVLKGELRSGQKIELHRSPENSPNPLPKLWGVNPLEFEVFENHSSQLATLVEKIKHNIHKDGLNPSRDILVIILGGTEEPDSTAKEFYYRVANNLQMSGINYYMPGALMPNRYPDSNNRDGADVFWVDGAVTVSQIFRAKGHEAPMIYVVGLEAVAQNEENPALRNQLFVALTRSRAWVHLSGIKNPDTHTDYLLYEELRDVIASGNTFTFTFRRPTISRDDQLTNLQAM